jgi:predicted nucleic-acid-binding protein
VRLVGIDTNILLCVIVNDDPGQRRGAVEFLNNLSDSERGFVGLVVLTETYWTLTSRYRYASDKALDSIKIIVESARLVIEELNAVIAAIRVARVRKVDFADLLIAGKNHAVGCSHTVTFDRRASKSVPGMELLA